MNAPHGSGVDFFVVVLLLHGAIRKFCVTTTWHCCFHTQKESGLHIFYVPDFCYQHCHFHAPLIYSKLNGFNFTLFQCKSAEHLTILFNLIYTTASAPGKEPKKLWCACCMFMCASLLFYRALFALLLFSIRFTPILSSFLALSLIHI